MSLKPGLPPSSKKRVRMRDVATRCGVSISTVSLVLSGDTRIPEDTARKVLQTVKAMEYRPSVIARSLARRGSRTVGVILPSTAFERNQPFYYAALAGIHSKTQPAGYKMVVEAANRVFLERRYYLRLLKEQSTDAILYMAAAVSDAFIGDMAKEPYPFALLGSSVDGLELPRFVGNDVEGAKTATAHLISLGHKAIGHLSGPQDISNGRDREKGYRDAMQQAGLTVEPSWVLRADFDFVKAEAMAKDLVNAGVTAIFAATDGMALSALRAVRSLSLRVPGDISVVGMDDNETSSWVEPALTSVRYDIKQMASQAAEFVLKSINNPMAKSNFVTETTPPQLMIRGSTGPKR